MDKISIIVPCYNEEGNIPVFYKEMGKTITKMEEIDYELIFVNDGSSDNSLLAIKKIARENQKVKYISFTRNFGKEAAMLAGLQKAEGNFVVIMDADLQHPVELLPEMYDAVKYESFDCACAKRMGREGDGKLRRGLTKRFYKLINKMSEIEMVDGAGDYRMMSRKMVDSVLLFKEYNRYSKGLFSFVGFETKMIPYRNVERSIGATKWSIFSLTKYALDGIISFSTVPLVLSSVCGVISCCIALIMGAYIAVKTIIYGNPTDGWATLICIILLIGGLQMFFLGIIGEYLSKVYKETKQRPIFIVQETNINPLPRDSEVV